MLQAALQQPAPGWNAEAFFEAALERRQALAAEAGVVFEPEVVAKVLFEYPPEADGVIVGFERTEKVGDVLVRRIADHLQDEFAELEFEQGVVHLLRLVEIRHDRLEESMDGIIGSDRQDRGQLASERAGRHARDAPDRFPDEPFAEKEQHDTKARLKKLLDDVRAFAYEDATAFREFERGSVRVPGLFAVDHIHEIVLVAPEIDLLLLERTVVQRDQLFVDGELTVVVGILPDLI